MDILHTKLSYFVLYMQRNKEIISNTSIEIWLGLVSFILETKRHQSKPHKYFPDKFPNYGLTFPSVIQIFLKNDDLPPTVYEKCLFPVGQIN